MRSLLNPALEELKEGESLDEEWDVEEDEFDNVMAIAGDVRRDNGGTMMGD